MLILLGLKKQNWKKEKSQMVYLVVWVLINTKRGEGEKSDMLAERFERDGNDIVWIGTPNQKLEGFIVSVSQRSKFKRLHFLGRCPCRPGVDYRMWTHHGMALKGATYNDHCHRCWRDGTGPEKALEGSESSGSSSSTSTSTPSEKEV